ncbi:uncharacterized protein LOC112157844 isoform X2 [Oryzias melastigma]|uniref:uncharacterized protein LOC112157844 isoform X2 n=1 Tax=Oryzias melastigma TaxID=30732 RepID=UPI000CF7F014|nr:uncharacterized protein LOC112157844 isoform X2 [Oryzias melastigma]
MSANLSYIGETMSTLLKEIEKYDACAASELRKADFRTDSEIRTLTPEDLHELFPGQENLLLRKTIFEIIHKQKRTRQCQEKLGLIPQDTLRNVVIAECFEWIKNIKDQLEVMQTVLEARYNKPKDINKTTVKYKMVVSDKTFGAHDQILEQIKSSGLNLIKGNDEESCITIVFCPVGTRIGTDAVLAMKRVPGSDPVILVMMHFSQEQKKTHPTGISTGFPNIVLEVHVFYHQKQNGLLRCEQNNKAVIELKEELMKHHSSQNSGSNY